MPFVKTNAANDQHVTASVYAGCIYAYVASENQPLKSTQGNDESIIIEV